MTTVDDAERLFTLHPSLRNYDMTHMGPKVYQGRLPPAGVGLAYSGFGLLVLCAREHQPAARNYPGVEVIRLPFDDCDSLAPATLARAAEIAQRGAAYVVAGKRVLNTCNLGLNRSGIVTALTLYYLRPHIEQKQPDAQWMDAAIRHIARTRGWPAGGLTALCNVSFVESLQAWAELQA